MDPKQHPRAHKSITRHRQRPGRLLALLGACALGWAALHTTPARADYKVKYYDVACGGGLTLSRASGVPAGAVHSYVFRGFCSLRSIFDTGPYVDDHPPLTATARWEKASSTYTESLHLLAATKISQAAFRGPGGMWASMVPLTTAPEEATFKCDVDPIINKTARCTLVTHFNGTGWGGQHDGFAYSAVRDRPLLAGRATRAQASALSKHNAPINCRALRLTAATGVPGSKKRTYRFNGTCQLYHTLDGSGGLQVTHVLANGKWDAVAHQAAEGVTVLVAPNKGGGGWSTKYSCTSDPWLNRHAHCSKTSGLGHVPPVYAPITDILNQHPITMGLVNAAQAAQLSGSSAGGKQATKSRPVFGLGHRGTVNVSAKSHAAALPKPRLIIKSIKAAVTHDCSSNHLASVTVTILNEGGPLKSLAPYAYVHAEESGGARLISPHLGLLAIGPGQTWNGVLALGTSKSFLSKLPGTHTLYASIGPSNINKSKLAFVPPPPARLTLKVPSGYCQPRLQVRSPSQMHLHTGSSNMRPGTPSRVHPLVLPAVQERAR